MNNINQYIFDLIHVLAHLRDTLEYVLPNEHDAKLFDQRKAVLTKALDPETPLGKFFANNEEQFKPTIEKYKSMLDELYGENSTVLTKTSDGKIRVDHSQHLKIYDFIVNIVEPIKDIVYFHLNMARQKQENQPIIEDLLNVDDNYYRVFAYLLMIQDFQKSFFEFQKVMGEAQGKPTPQSNFIVQNELMVYSKMLKDLRAHTRFTDNKTLDLLDETLRLIEMSEGRRDRVDNKSFKDLFQENITHLNEEFVKNLTQVWRERFDKALKEMIEEIRKNTEASNKTEA